MILQSHNNKKQHGIDRKTDTLISETELEAQRYIHAPMDTLSLTTEPRIYNGEKTI